MPRGATLASANLDSARLGLSKLKLAAVVPADFTFAGVLCGGTLFFLTPAPDPGWPGGTLWRVQGAASTYQGPGRLWGSCVHLSSITYSFISAEYGSRVLSCITCSCAKLSTRPSQRNNAERHRYRIVHSGAPYKMWFSHSNFCAQPKWTRQLIFRHLGNKFAITFLFLVCLDADL